MANVNATVAYFKEEVTAGTAVLPSDATDGYCAVEKPDVTTGQKELLESALLTSKIGNKKPQLGMESASCSVTTELRSHGDSSNPTVPDFDILLKSGIGPSNISVTDAVEASPSPTTTAFEVATIANFAVGDMIIIDNATDGRIVRFIEAITGDLITVNVAMDNAPTAADVVYATVNYKPTETGHKHFTSGFYQGNDATDGYFEQVIGCLTSKVGISIDAAALAKLAFEMTGISADRTANTAASYSPDLEAVQGLAGFEVECYFGATKVCGNKLAIDIENDVKEKKTFCTASGKNGSIISKRKVSGSINPYADGSTDYYDALNSLTDFKFMAVIGAKDANGFIVGKTVAIYLPQIMITQCKSADEDDNLIEDIQFSAHTGSDGNQLDFVLSFG